MKGNTIDPMENEENVAFILREFPMRLVPIEAEWRFGKAGLENCGLNREQCEMVQRYNMTEKCNSIRFFVSKFE